MNILHLDENHPLLINQLNDAGHANKKGYALSREAVLEVIEDFQGVVVRSRITIDKEFIDAAKNLRFVARVGAGLESIDVDYAKERKIELFSAPEGNRNAVGEHTLGMLLALFNKLNTADKDVKNGHWNREIHRGIELDGKIVGIIGYGHMGKSFAEKLKGFNCTVFCYDIKEEVGNHNATQVSLKTFQEMVDVVSLHTPWTPLTHQMVDRAFISEFKKPFWLLNTARGKNVVTKDLVEALQEGTVLGAGLDVLEYEKSSFESLFSKDMPKELQQLLEMDQVILSPHVAGWTVESKQKLAETIVEKILTHFKQ